MMETWRPIPNFPSYEASARGDIRKIFKSTIHVLKPFDNGCGYFTIKAGPKGELKSVLVHKLVASTFHGERPAGLVVNHKDGNKRNNRFENLEYVTKEENQAHAVTNLLTAWGERNPLAKLNSDQVFELVTLAHRGTPRKELSRLFGISLSQVGRIVRRKQWAHLEI